MSGTQEKAEGLAQKAAETIKEQASNVKDTAQKAAETLKDQASKLNLSDTASKAAEAVKSGAEKLTETVSSGFQNVKEKIHNMTSSEQDKDKEDRTKK